MPAAVLEPRISCVFIIEIVPQQWRCGCRGSELSDFESLQIPASCRGSGYLPAAAITSLTSPLGGVILAAAAGNVECRGRGCFLHLITPLAALCFFFTFCTVLKQGKHNKTKKLKQNLIVQN